MTQNIVTLAILALTLASNAKIPFSEGLKSEVKGHSTTVLSERSFSMEKRYPVESVSKIFKDNILLNLAYLDGKVTPGEKINWEQIDQPFEFKIALKPDQTFVYHQSVLEKYKGKDLIIGNSRFNQSDGYKSDGLLFGDGVCHLASLLSWAAKDAKLDVVAPSNHDFAAIPEVPKSQGVAIYYDPNNPSKSAQENLYITNNQGQPIDIVFSYQNSILKISITKNT